MNNYGKVLTITKGETFSVKEFVNKILAASDLFDMFTQSIIPFHNFLPFAQNFVPCEVSKQQNREIKHPRNEIPVKFEILFF